MIHGTLRPLPRSALAGDPLEVAPRLLGLLVCRDEIAARVVEVEAYLPDDPASHARNGPTRRSRPMFGPPGTGYAYLSYGVHWCLNVTVAPDGVGAAVLLRAAIVERGEQSVRQRRSGDVDRVALLRGPGNLGRGLAVSAEDSDRDLIADGGPTPGHLWLGVDDAPAPGWQQGPRVGVRRAADRPWRWWVPGRPEVSRYRRHPDASESA